MASVAIPVENNQGSTKAAGAQKAFLYTKKVAYNRYNGQAKSIQERSDSTCHQLHLRL